MGRRNLEGGGKLPPVHVESANEDQESVEPQISDGAAPQWNKLLVVQSLATNDFMDTVSIRKYVQKISSKANIIKPLNSSPVALVDVMRQDSSSNIANHFKKCNRKCVSQKAVCGYSNNIPCTSKLENCGNQDFSRGYPTSGYSRASHRETTSPDCSGCSRHRTRSTLKHYSC